MNAPKQMKPGAPKAWIPSHSSLQSYKKSLYKFVAYYIIDHNYNTVAWNIRKLIAGYIMSLERKQRVKLKAKECTDYSYHHLFNKVLESSSKFLQSNIYKECCVLNTTDYNYKLRSVIGREDDTKVTKWT